MCVWGLLVVVALVMLRSLEVIAGPGHSWAGVRAVNTDAPLQFLSALVIVIFGFHVRCACRLCAAVGAACWALHAWRPPAALPHPPCMRPRSAGPCSRLLQSHTNVVTIFDELEEQPTFFSSPSYTLGQAAAAAAADGQPAPAEGGLAAADGGGGGGGRGSNGSGGNGRRPRSAKLVGMVGVVSLGLLVTGVLYTVVGERRVREGWAGLACSLGACCAGPRTPEQLHCCLRPPCCVGGQQPSPMPALKPAHPSPSCPQAWPAPWPSPSAPFRGPPRQRTRKPVPFLPATQAWPASWPSPRMPSPTSPSTLPRGTWSWRWRARPSG